MKNFLLIFLVSLPGYADEMPSWWNLPNEGKYCFQTGQFQSEPTDCGVRKVESWTCIEPSENKFERAYRTNYLLDGVYMSDFGNNCSPTYVVEKVIEQK